MDLRHHRPRVRVPAPRHLDLATRQATYLTFPIPWTSDLRPLPRGKTIAFETNEEGLSVLTARHGSGKEKPARRSRSASSAAWSGTTTGATSASFSLGPSPADVYSFDVATGSSSAGRKERDGRPETPRAFSEPSSVRWKELRRPTISGFLYKPAPASPARVRSFVKFTAGPEGQVAPRLPGAEQLLPRRAGGGDSLPDVAARRASGKTS